MKKSFTLITLFTLLTGLIGCSRVCQKCQAKKQMASQINLYETKSHNLVKLINDKSSAKELVIARAKELVEISKPVLMGFQKKYPQCQGYLQTVLDNAQKMQTISLNEIEEKWHEGKALPEDTDSVCMETKELIVHPSTVVILANNDFNSKKNKEQMSDEINEVIEHMTELKESI